MLSKKGTSYNVSEGHKVNLVKARAIGAFF